MNRRVASWLADLVPVATTVYMSSLESAFAYVDPGSGSIIVTTILGFIAAVGYTFRKYFYNLKRMLTGLKKEPPKKD